jgi:hypothetical protein
MDQHVTLRTLSLESCHQAREKTKVSHLLDKKLAFTETSALCEERAMNFHSSGGEIILGND